METPGPRFSLRASFTLIELLVVIAIVAILSVVVILTLNPVEMLRQSRDSTRLSDLSSMATAMGVLIADQPGVSLGTASTVYVSIADSATDCSNLALGPLPGGWSYHCAPSSTLRSVDGTGWIPVNLASTSAGAPIAQLPIDPVNATSSGLYYTYIAGSGYELTGLFEARKYSFSGDSDKESNDGGAYPDLFEVGTNLRLAPVDPNPELVGYWNFEEGSGSTVVDHSRGNATGTWSGTLGSQWGSGKIGSYAGSFNGTDNLVNVAALTKLKVQNLTVSLWLKPSALATWNYIVSNHAADFANGYRLEINSSGDFYFSVDNGISFNDCTDSGRVTVGPWQYLAATYDSSAIKLYANGTLVKSCSIGNKTIAYDNNASPVIGSGNPGNAQPFSGAIDDVRVYRRALTAAEISILYNFR